MADERERIARIVFDAIEERRGMPPIGDVSWAALHTQERNRLPLQATAVTPAYRAAFDAADRILRLHHG